MSYQEASTDMILKGMPVTVTWLDPLSLPAPAEIRDRVMGVCVVPFTRDGRVVLARLNRGCEIPGGGMEDADADFVATARREAWEETRIGLGELSLVQFVRIRRRDKSCSPSYAVIYAGMVTWMPRFVRRHESYGRVLVDPHELPHAVGFGTLADRKRLVAAARAAMACAGRVQAA